MSTEFGKTYQDVVSGFVGEAVGKADWAYSGPTTALVPPVSKTNDEPRVVWFEDARLVEVTPAED